ncbi:TPA: hypothetical protein N0F65_008886 [Lagenidium giganteum]|uniref:PH domain-containing protein n=1 Tax=Lagenidium giganteum TaxID=4803 RepID=A0AAV2YTR5_9STRA|nr:TPA: hypothetical protein N0F65_008886 [Lagenidium giganteum]
MMEAAAPGAVADATKELAQVRSTPLPGREQELMAGAAPPRPRSGSVDEGLVVMRRRSSVDNDTPFEMHLRDIYAVRGSRGLITEREGLEFFESHGYYDVSEANTVAMFRQNFGMDAFWEESDMELQSDFLSQVLPPKVQGQRFQLLDDDGNEIDEEQRLEMEKEARMKAQSMELDEDDIAELEREKRTVVKAIIVIRTEKIRFHRYFSQAFNDDDARASQRIMIPQQTTPLSIQLPPYSGYIYLLKDTIPHVLRSWHKRWLYLDFNIGVVMMYKRSYWKSPRGVLDLRNVHKVLKMNHCDMRIDCMDHSTMLLRTKTPEQAELWVNLLQFAKRQVRAAPPHQPAVESSASAASQMSSTRHKRSRRNQSVRSDWAAVSLLNVLLQASPNNITAA